MLFHITKKGIPAECKAVDNNCKVSSPEEHYSSLEQAQKAVDIQMATQFSLFPDVHFVNSIIPDDQTMQILSTMYSELYVASKFVQDVQADPVICLGKNSKDESVYHCIYMQDDMYYDINGLIALDLENLEKYIKEKYEINSNWIVVDTEKSIQMIENLINVNIKNEGAKKRLLKHLKDELKSSKENSNKFIAISFLLKELE